MAHAEPVRGLIGARARRPRADAVRDDDAELAALWATGRTTFNVPGAPPEAPLSHLVIHTSAYCPLDVPSPTDPENAGIALEQLLSPRARSSLVPGLVDGLAFVGTDSDVRHGTAPIAVAA